MVKCKFRVYEKTIRERNNYNGFYTTPTVVKLTPCQGEPFGAYTPSGNIEMLILNDDAEKQFEVGKEYFVDFYPAK